MEQNKKIATTMRWKKAKVIQQTSNQEQRQRRPSRREWQSTTKTEQGQRR
jgi:hypothetical protein